MHADLLNVIRINCKKPNLFRGIKKSLNIFKTITLVHVFLT